MIVADTKQEPGRTGLILEELNVVGKEFCVGRVSLNPKH